MSETFPNPEDWVEPPENEERQQKQNGPDQQGKGNGPDPNAGKAQPDYDLINALSIYAWCDREIPPVRRLLGELLVVGGRLFLVGMTGIGKTLFVHAMAAAFARGKDFLHWACDEAVRVLIVDGEMSVPLTKKRAKLLRDRHPDIPPDKLMIYSMQLADEFAKRFPHLGRPAPLNTKQGQEWLLKFIALVQPGVVILDNVMSLIAGVQKDEEPWKQTEPLVLGISELGIAQIWLDHTGWNTDRQYGSSIKGWLMDAVGMMLEPTGHQSVEKETVFDLSFDPPGGKARNRDPDNWDDFAPHRIRLADDEWSSEPLKGDRGKRGRSGRGRPKSPTAKEAVLADLIHRDLCNLLADPGEGQDVPLRPGMPSVRAVRRSRLHETIIQAGNFELKDENAPLQRLKDETRQQFVRAINRLTREDKVVADRHWVGLP